MLHILYGVSATALDGFRATDKTSTGGSSPNLERMVERTLGETERLTARPANLPR